MNLHENEQLTKELLFIILSKKQLGSNTFQQKDALQREKKTKKIFVQLSSWYVWMKQEIEQE